MNTTATATADGTATTAAADRFSLSRTIHLARWNAVLLTRNRLALLYGAVLPLAPLLFLLSGDRGAVGSGAAAAGGVLVTAGLFPVFYNLLSQFVSRRDELVLKRMRTGEIRDGELLLAIALPGVACALVVSVAAVLFSVAAGQRLPLNPVLYAGGTMLALIMFAAFAYWTAAWTRNAEAAQLTSMPVIILVVAGQVGVAAAALSGPVREVLSWTPGAAMIELVRVGWFGLDGALAIEPTLAFSDTWAAAGQPLLAMTIWTALALVVASRSMRWEPRA